MLNDINYWKRKNKIEDKAKIFIVSGGYGDIRRSLLERGILILKKLIFL